MEWPTQNASLTPRQVCLRTASPEYEYQTNTPDKPCIWTCLLDATRGGWAKIGSKLRVFHHASRARGLVVVSQCLKISSPLKRLFWPRHSRLQRPLALAGLQHHAIRDHAPARLQAPLCSAKCRWPCVCPGRLRSPCCSA